MSIIFYRAVRLATLNIPLKCLEGTERETRERGGGQRKKIFHASEARRPYPK